MNRPACALYCVALLLLVSLAGCDVLKKGAAADPAPSAGDPASQPGASPAPAAGDTADKGDKSGAAAAAPSPPATKGPTTTVTDGQKKVTTDGKNVQLQNESGKGSVTTSGGKTTVTGKSGKSVQLPIDVGRH